MSATVDLAELAKAAVPVALVERLRASRQVLVGTHEHPDADTLGAAVAISAIVEALGNRATVVCADSVPALYGFLPGMDRVRAEPDPEAAYDLLVLCDCGTPERVGPIAQRHPELFGSLPRIVIDHHASNAGGPSDWIDPGAAATCELVTLLAVRLGIALDGDDGLLANVLMAGIVMDTSTFAHPNATPRTLAVSAALVEAGAALSDISRRLYRTKPDSQLRLFGRVLDRIETTPDRRILWSTLTLADLAASGAHPAHSEGIIELLAQSDTADVAMLLKEQPDGTTRLSDRTKPGGVDATVLTGRFGGGGHARASGATINAPLAAAIELVLAEAQPLVDLVQR